MKRKNRGRNIRCILTLHNENMNHWYPKDSRIYLQIEKNPRKLKLNETVISMYNSHLMKVEYILGIQAKHRRYSRNLNRILENVL